MRRLVAITMAVVLTVAACGDDDDDGATESGGSTPTTAASESTTTTRSGDGDGDGGSTTTQIDGIDPMEDASTDPVQRDPGAQGTALLTDVRVARHEGFDRVVFEFDGPVPGYDVEYVQPPITEDGSGDEIEVAGDAFLSVTMRPASGFDLSEGEGEPTYDGPTRLAGEDAGTSVIREVVRTGDFEAVLGWVVGISDRVDFRVDELSAPSRLVVDVRNH